MIIDNGKVKQIKNAGSNIKAERSIDAKENLVIPGASLVASKAARRPAIPEPTITKS